MGSSTSSASLAWIPTRAEAPRLLRSVVDDVTVEGAGTPKLNVFGLVLRLTVELVDVEACGGGSSASERRKTK